MMDKSILKFGQWIINEDATTDPNSVDVTQNIKDLETDRIDAQAIVAKITSLQSISTAEQIESNKETINNQYKDKTGTATKAALTLLELESQHRLYQLKTQEAQKSFTEAMDNLNKTITDLKSSSTTA